MVGVGYDGCEVGLWGYGGCGSRVVGVGLWG